MLFSDAGTLPSRPVKIEQWMTGEYTESSCGTFIFCRTNLKSILGMSQSVNDLFLLQYNHVGDTVLFIHLQKQVYISVHYNLSCIKIYIT